MTRNQIEYYKAKTGRLEYEEAKRHNLVYEGETERHNRAGEEVAMNNYLLGVRSQTEVERHNQAVEAQTNQSIAVARQQAQASMLGAQASMAAAAASMANAQANQRRADIEAQLLPYREESERQSALTTEQQGKMYSSQAELYSAQASRYNERTDSEIDLNNARANASRNQGNLWGVQAELYPRTLELTERGQDKQYEASVINTIGHSASTIGASAMNTAAKYEDVYGSGIWHP